MCDLTCDARQSTGANGILLEGVGDEQSGSVGTGTEHTSYSGGSGMSGGIGINVGMSKKVGGD
jgi:hypothetical protein